MAARIYNVAGITVEVDGPTQSYRLVRGMARIANETTFNDVLALMRPLPSVTKAEDAVMHGSFKVKASGGGLQIGFKQIAFFKFRRQIYVGLKPSDGAIKEGSTLFNFENFLDCQASDTGRAPWAPFYVPPVELPAGKQITVSMADQPGGGGVRVERRNEKTDRRMLLQTYNFACDFETYLVARSADGHHHCLEGFSWGITRDIRIRWEADRPEIKEDNGWLHAISTGHVPPVGSQRRQILENQNLKDDRILVRRFNDAITQAAAAHEKKEPPPPGAGYEIVDLKDWDDEDVQVVIQKG